MSIWACRSSPLAGRCRRRLTSCVRLGGTWRPSYALDWTVRRPRRSSALIRAQPFNLPFRTSIVSQADAQAYDLEAAAAWSALTGTEIRASEDRLWLPGRLGGLGATSASSRAPAAAWTGWTFCTLELVAHFDCSSPAALFEQCQALRNAVVDLHSRVVGLGAPPALSAVTWDVALRHDVKLSYIMGFVHKRVSTRLVAALDTDDLAFFRSTRGPGASAFLEVPLEDRYVMADDRFAVAIRRRLGHPHPQTGSPPSGPVHCKHTTQAGRVCDAVLDPRGAHLECCAPGGGLVARHDGITNLLAALARRHMDPRPRLEQVLPQLQSRVSGQVGQARLDVVMHDSTRRYLVDVTVVSAYAGNSSFRAACARRDGHAARRAAMGKRLKYDSADLVPFALETGGRVGGDARALLQALVAEADDPAFELAYAYRALSSVLQDGVARQLLL